MLRPTATVLALIAMAGFPAFLHPVSAAAGTPASDCSKSQVRAVRSLSSASASQLQQQCRAYRKHHYTVAFWRSKKHHWVLMSRQGCTAAPGSHWRRMCTHGRRDLRKHLQGMASSSKRIRQLAAAVQWQSDLAKTNGARACIAYRETHGSSHPYTQQNLNGGDYWGKYQWGPPDWRKARDRARSYYGIRISSASRADEATPWAQEVVTAFAVAHPAAVGWKPWAYCY